jgi:hypothetical protein
MVFTTMVISAVEPAYPCGSFACCIVSSLSFFWWCLYGVEPPSPFYHIGVAIFISIPFTGSSLSSSWQF